MHLRKIWQELDHRKPISFTQPDVVQVRQKEIEEERVYIFLAGLDDIYDRVRSDILRANPFPNPEYAFAMVRSKEQWRNTMLNNNTNSSMAMATKVSFVQNQDYHSKTHSNGEKGCTHCGNSKHAVENCFKLHGYPDWWDGLNEKKSKEQRNRKDGDKNYGKVAVMVSTSTSLPTTRTALVNFN
ncbi:hypothetical protein KY290_036333 [Solanum tuberosum]|uniref:Uncharacterized protein n=1 Tax=Solanum tuberosum TaxID=4113 RepID=A0ABQ7TUB3_SOLTU|nr:hypothetical protein KY289_035849 [Solanum tuberosum]KAH0639034.1 hypothetical protein KY285_035620 [Solanum tuberosum]KAH0737628.1 hypothetical protein KY290_036333 [Solanum tuberosum]